MNANRDPIDPIEVLQKIGWEEGNDLEFKSAKGGLPKSLWETYSAMANTQGGTILLGVEDDGTVSGVSDAIKLKGDFWNTINNRGKVCSNLLTDHDVAVIESDTGRILAIRIPAATRFQKPVYIGQNPITGTYRRNHEGDYHCSEREVSRMLADASDESADSLILEHFCMDDVDMPSLQQYRQRFASFKPTHPWLNTTDQELLSKLGGWRRDRSSGQEGLTAAGLLMFGREESIREGMPGYHVDFREKLSDDPAVRWTDRLTLDGTWAGNIFQFYFKTIQRLFADLKLQFKLDSDLFRKGETEVHEAVREALVNALIHADYRGQGGIIIEKYRDRFEFSNPGSLLVSVEQLFRGNVSECRNKALQTMFMMIGGAEKAGSGIDRIQKGWESQHWRYPMIRLHMQPDRVYWRLPMVSLLPAESLTCLQKLFGTSVFDRLNENEVQVLVTAEVEGGVDNLRMQQLMRKHSADITKTLQKLVSLQFLVQEGRGRWTRYRLPDSVHSESDSVHNNPADHAESMGISKEELFRLKEIAKPALDKKRLIPRHMERIILSLCTECFLTRRQLADLLNRNADGLRTRFLTPMINHGLMVLRFPDKPNRTDQAYTATEKGKSAVAGEEV
ncbi:MAG: RNA-binding domain-containing protein [Pontiella sp.]